MTGDLNGATLRVIAHSLGLHRAADLAYLLDRNERTVKRWFTDERPISSDVQQTVRGWQIEASNKVESTIDALEKQLAAGSSENIKLTRYPHVSSLRRHHPHEGIVSHSSETWDAYLARVVTHLEDIGAAYIVDTELN